MRINSGQSAFGFALVGGLELGREQVASAEDVHGQIAVGIVVAMEEPTFLLAVQRDIRCIDIEHDGSRWCVVGVHKEVFKRLSVVENLEVRTTLIDGGWREFDAVERRVTGLRDAMVETA